MILSDTLETIIIRIIDTQEIHKELCQRYHQIHSMYTIDTSYYIQNRFTTGTLDTVHIHHTAIHHTIYPDVQEFDKSLWEAASTLM